MICWNKLGNPDLAAWDLRVQVQIATGRLEEAGKSSQLQLRGHVDVEQCPLFCKDMYPGDHVQHENMNYYASKSQVFKIWCNCLKVAGYHLWHQLVLNWPRFLILQLMIISSNVRFKILDNSILIGRNRKTPTLKNAECLSGGQVKWSVAEESVEDWGERQGKLRLNCDGVTEL